MARRSNVTACSMGPEATRAFGDVCELFGRICDSDASGGADGLGLEGFDDLLAAHRTLMGGVPGAGELRRDEARILRGARVMHVPPMAGRVPALMDDLMAWLSETEDHPLIASCVFHYHLLYIHPFSDGNGRLARQWQSLIVERWRPGAGPIDLEAAVDARKEAYLEALSASDRQKDAGPFALFMLGLLRDALEKIADGRRDRPAPPPAVPAAETPAPGAPKRLPESVERLLEAFDGRTLTGMALMKNLDLSHRGTFRKNYLDPALEMGLAEMTQPDSPRSPTQRYRLTPAGKRALEAVEADR